MTAFKSLVSAGEQQYFRPNDEIIRITPTLNKDSTIIISTMSVIREYQQQQNQQQRQNNDDFNSNNYYYNFENDHTQNHAKGRFLDFESFINSNSYNNDNDNHEINFNSNNYNNYGIITTNTNSYSTNEILTDEARYNLATRIMSNGVEVIVASDKSKTQQQLNNKYSPSKIMANLQKPLTLAPSTLKDQMILVMPSDKKNNLTISINPNQFLTKTCLTTYTYRTTYLKDGTTTIESREKVISNIATEERNYLKISPTASSGIVLSKTPELAVGIFRTTYKYLNTFIDGEQPIVVSSKHVVTNTITGPNDYISFLQPSEDATPVHDTNTYFTKIMMTKTFQKNGVSKILSTSNILTQVVVTESLPPKSISVMTSYIAFDDVDDIDGSIHENENNDDNYNKNDSKLKSTSTLKTKFSKISSTKTSKISSSTSNINSNSNDHDNDDEINIDNSENDILSSADTESYNKIEQASTGIHVYATKTYLTTFTYFTTLLKSNEHEISSTIIDSHTRVTENVITETIPQYILNTNLLETLTNLLLHGTKHPKGITTMATFPGGQSLEITAIKDSITKHNNQSHHQISSTKHIEISSVSSSSSSSSSYSSSSTIPQTLITSSTNNIASSINDDNNNYSNNDSDDNEAAGTNNDEIYDDQYYSQQQIQHTDVDKNNYNAITAQTSATASTKNVTKTSNHHHHNRPEFPPVSNLINSLNLDGLTALGPVFNAMAGLIQNNFKTATNILKKNNNTNSSYNIDNRHASKNISSTYDNDQSSSALHKSQHHLPVYIPVQNVNIDNDQFNNNQNSNVIIHHGSPQSLHVSPPPIPDKWLSDEKMNRNNKLESSSIENNKLTFEQPLLNGGIPISPGEVITANSDVIVGKPAGTRPRIPFNSKFTNDASTSSSSTATTVTSLGKLNASKYLSLSKYLENRNNNNGVYDKNYEQFIRPPPPPPPFIKHNENVGYSTNSGNRIRLPHQTNKMPIIHHQQNEYEHPQHIPINGNLYPQTKHSSDTRNGNGNNYNVQTSEILEIKKMPEIYSTNLPPFEIYAHQHSHVKKVISSDKPMLVNIQPSQVANVVIPHGNSASVLIIESPVELHKNGEYFDEPSPYPNTIFSKTTNQNNEYENKDGTSDKSSDIQQRPISSNQQINLHAGVLSHDVNINVPPLTFRKENEFPHSTPIQGHSNQHVRKNGPLEIPHITILPTDHEIHVNLTPQHYIVSDMFMHNDNLHKPPNKFSPLPLPVKRKPFQNNEEFNFFKNNTRLSINNQNHNKLKTPPPIPTLNRSPNIPPLHAPYSNKFNGNGKYPLQKLNYPQFELNGPLKPPLPSPQQLPPHSPPPYIPHQPPHFIDQNNNKFQNQRYGMKESFTPNQQRPIPVPLHKVSSSPSQQTNSPPPFKYQPQKLHPVSHIPPIEQIFDFKLNKHQQPPSYNATINIEQNQILHHENNQNTYSNAPQYPQYNNDENIYLSSNQTIASGTENFETYYDTEKGQNVNISHLSSFESSPTSSVTFYDDDDADDDDSDTKLSEYIIHNYKQIPNITQEQLPSTKNWQSTPQTSPTTTPQQVRKSTVTEKTPYTTSQSQTTSFKVQNRIKQRPSPFDMPPPSVINQLYQIETHQEKPTITIPSKGRPFHMRHPSQTRKPSITNSQPSIFQEDLIVLPKPGQKFRKPSSHNKNIPNFITTTNSVYDNFTNNLSPYIQTSMSADSNAHETANNYKITNIQTESPLHITNSIGIDETTSVKPITTTPSTTSNWNLDLNTLEIVTKPKNDNDRDSGEIFDFRESVNPHNLGVIANAGENENKIMRNITKGTMKPNLNYGSYKTTIRHSIFIPTTSYPYVSEPSVNMKPPAPSLSSLSSSLVTNEVMGLSPPPPPTSLSPPPSSSISSQSSLMYDTTFMNENYLNNNANKQHPLLSLSKPFIFMNESILPNSHTPPKGLGYYNIQKTENKSNMMSAPMTTTTTKKSTTTFTTTTIRTTKKVPEKPTLPPHPSTLKIKTTSHPVFAVTIKTSHNVINDNNTTSTVAAKTESKVQDQQTSQIKQSTYQISPTPIVKNDFYDYIAILPSKSSNYNTSQSSPVHTSMLDESQAISDDILMLGSEYPYKEDSIKSIIYPTPEGSDIEKTIILLPDDATPMVNRTKTTISSVMKGTSTHQQHTTINTKPLKMTVTKTLNEAKNTVSEQTPILTTGSALGTPTIIEIVTKAHTERVNVYPTRTQTKSYITTTTTTTTTTKTYYTTVKNKEYHHNDGFVNGTVIVLNPPVTKMKSKPTTEFKIIDYDKLERSTKTTLLQPSIMLSSSSISPSISTLPHQLSSSLSPTIPSSILLSPSSTFPPSLSTTILQLSPSPVPSTSQTSSSIHSFNEKHNHKDKPHNFRPTENESIFVVMTDKSNSGGIIHFNGTVLDAENSVDEPDYTNISFDVPNRDEDFSSNEANHVLLGGILIATPPKSKDISKYSSGRAGSIGGSECRPDCKASRNELCQRIENVMRCVCRPGFARMFPDRPCKPTYTYSLKLKLHRYGADPLRFHEHLNNKESDAYFYLSGITHEALDRMVMQSDFRDVYHGVHVTNFERSNIDDGIISNFYLQLSDNSDENRLVDVFKRYLRTKNYSIGGTELYTSKDGIEELKASDFNECLNSQFHDCSENSYCFNLHGTYTCSCKEGYADLSENAMYPGRICSTELIGCEQCHYHGTCYTPDDTENPICECFHWYAGSACQINLKILLIALIAIGTILLILLCFCIIVLCMKRRRTSTMQTLAGINIIPPKNIRHHFSPCNVKIDKRAMIKDSSSEASHNSDVLPYVSKKEEKKMSIISQSQSIQKVQQQQQRRQHQHQQQQQQQHQAEIERRCSLLDQNNRSISVMIPRAKYYSASHQIISSSSSHLIAPENGVGGTAVNSNNAAGINSTVITGGGRNSSCNPETNTKLLSYLDAGAQVTNIPKKFSSSSAKHSALHTTSTGALVSAGFEVSATVRQEAGLSSGDENNHNHHQTQKLIGGTLDKRTNFDDIIDGYKTNENQQGAFMENMDNWFDTMQQNELTASEARSYDETTIRPPTKSLRSVYEKHMSQLNDEANTMAERDIGSTFLLPHTHLYKPDRASDLSGFDSF